MARKGERKLVVLGEQRGPEVSEFKLEMMMQASPINSPVKGKEEAFPPRPHPLFSTSTFCASGIRMGKKSWWMVAGVVEEKTF